MDGLILSDNLSEALGIWTFTAYDGDIRRDRRGRILNRVMRQFEQRNLITTAGKQHVLDRLFGLSSAITLAGMAVGTSATAAAVGDTAITGAVYKVFDATPTRTSLTVAAVTTYNTGEANISIQEVGLLTASAGILFNRLAPVLSFTKTSSMSLTVTCTVSQA